MGGGLQAEDTLDSTTLKEQCLRNLQTNFSNAVHNS
jgi:hypothetical protein